MWPRRPASWIVVCGPGSSTWIMSTGGPDMAPKFAERRGYAPSDSPAALGRAPAQPGRASGSGKTSSSDHRLEMSRRHARRDVVVLAAVDRTKADAVAGLQQDRLGGLRIVQAHGCAAEQPESAGALHRIDAALDAADRHAPRRDLHPGAVQARDREA